METLAENRQPVAPCVCVCADTWFHTMNGARLESAGRSGRQYPFIHLLLTRKRDESNNQYSG